MKSSFIILFFFVLGIVISFLGYTPNWLGEDKFSAYALYLLMLMVGINVGSDRAMVSVFKQVKIKVLLVPLGIVIGSLAGASVVSFFLFHVSVGEAMAVGSGFGYYSLSAIIISQMRGDELGFVALTANIIREVFTLVLAPLLVRFFGKYSVVASGGATAMDTTLPVVVKFSGKDMTMIAIFSGIILSLLVPVLVPFCLSLF